MFYKKGVLKNFVKFTGKHLRQNLFSIKLQVSALQLYQKGESDTGDFLRISQNFQEHLCCRTPLGDCFCPLEIKKISCIRSYTRCRENTEPAQLTFACSMSTVETLEKGVKYV